MKMRRFLPCGLCALIVSSCLTEPDVALRIRTDASAYPLAPRPGYYDVVLRVELTNTGRRTVYLHRSCGYEDGPSRRMERVDGDGSRLRLDANVCTTAPLRPAIPLSRGQTYLDEVRLVSREDANASPPVTLAMRTGTFRLRYDVQRTSRVEGWAAVDLLPDAARHSNPFRIEAPQDE
jgi:hypothetical protein